MQNSILLFSLLFLLFTGCRPGRYQVALPKVDTEILASTPAYFRDTPLPPSPALTPEGREMVLLEFNEDRYAWVDATVENGEPFDYKRQLYGKGNQLTADAEAFPGLARRGRHTEKELRQTKLITGRSVARITIDGRPWGSSGVGFMAEDETLMSVLWADNQAAERLNLTHPDLARPLFHFWNSARELKHHEVDPATGEQLQLTALIYHGRRVQTKITGSRGWQESIFNDEILGTGHLEMWRDPDAEEQTFLEKHYSHLSPDQLADLQQMLFYIHTGEMVFFYINRYAFYEGHTEYRADPVSVALVFGLRSLEEAHAATGGDLYRYFTTHFTQNPE